MSEIVQNQYSSWQAENSAKFIYNGFIYVGQVDTDPLIESNRVRVYYIDENEQEVELAQPIHTNSSGFPVISETDSTVIQVRTESDYSVKVLNRGGAKEWYIPKASTLSPVNEIKHNDTKDRNATNAHDGIYSRNFTTVSQMRAQTSADGTVLNMLEMSGSKVFWRGYYLESDGGSNWGIVKTGDSSSLNDDGGYIFVIVNDAVNGVWVEANLKGKSLSVLKFGAKADRTFNSTLAFSNTITYLESVAESSQVAVTTPSMYIPAGDYLLDEFLIPANISIHGDGKTTTVLLLPQSGTSLIKRKYDDRTVSNSTFKGFGLSPLDPINQPPAGQTMMDLRGFTKCRWEDFQVYWCGGCNGISTANAPYTASSNWYNTFDHVFVERLASWPTGGVGWLIGSVDSAFQQSTTWTWHGGRTSGGGSGTCFNFAGCSTMNLFGHTIEGGSVVVGSTITNDRATRSVCFYGVYLEAVTSFRFRGSSEFCGVYGGRVTGVNIEDEGTNNTLLYEVRTQLPVGNTGTADFEFNQYGSRYPKVVSKFSGSPTWQFESNTGVQSEILGPTTNTANRAFRLFANNATDGIFEFGTAAIRPAIDDSLTIGDAGRRPSEIFCVNPTINTSDERLKTEIESLSEKEKDCALEIKSKYGKFKWLDSVERESNGGKKARIHVGVGAQTVGEIFKKHGLNPDEYSIFCYDSWDDDKDENGKILLKAGDRYGIRLEQLNAFIIASI